MKKQYYLVAHKALFSGLPSIGIFEEESKAFVKGQLAIKFMEYGNSEPLIFTGDLDEIRNELKYWCELNNFKYSEQDTGSLLSFTVNAK